MKEHLALMVQLELLVVLEKEGYLVYRAYKERLVFKDKKENLELELD